MRSTVGFSLLGEREGTAQREGEGASAGLSILPSLWTIARYAGSPSCSALGSSAAVSGVVARGRGMLL